MTDILKLKTVLTIEKVNGKIITIPNNSLLPISVSGMNISGKVVFESKTEMSSLETGNAFIYLSWYRTMVEINEKISIIHGRDLLAIGTVLEVEIQKEA